MESKEYFVRVPVSILMDDRLTRSSVLLYAVMIDVADGNGIILDYTIERLADTTGLSPATVRRSERQLVDANLISITRTGRASMIMVNRAEKLLRQVSGTEAYKAARWKEREHA